MKKKWKCPNKHDNVKGLDYCVHVCHCREAYCYLGVPKEEDARNNQKNVV